MEVSLRYQLTLISLFSSGHLTDSECNQKLPSKKGSLIERKRSSGRVRRKGDESQASGYHSEGKPPAELLFLSFLCLAFVTLQPVASSLCSKAFLSRLWGLGIHDGFKRLQLFHSLCF